MKTYRIRYASHHALNVIYLRAQCVNDAAHRAHQSLGQIIVRSVREIG